MKVFYLINTIRRTTHRIMEYFFWRLYKKGPPKVFSIGKNFWHYFSIEPISNVFFLRPWSFLEEPFEDQMGPLEGLLFIENLFCWYSIYRRSLLIVKLFSKSCIHRLWWVSLWQMKSCDYILYFICHSNEKEFSCKGNKTKNFWGTLSPLCTDQYLIMLLLLLFLFSK